MSKIVILGNSGSGKTTLAKKLQEELNAPVLDLDTITWVPDQPGVRRELAESQRLLEEFIAGNPQWIIEGCYGQLIEYAVRQCSELIFLNPGVAACLENNLRRPWEPHKYASLEEQNQRLAFLQEWVKDYSSRHDEFSLARHRQIFDSFLGKKREIT